MSANCSSSCHPSADSPQPSEIATDDEHLYVTINNQNGAPVGGVVEIDKASGAVTVLVRDELNPLGIAVDSRHVYYTRRGVTADSHVQRGAPGAASRLQRVMSS